MKSKYFLSLVVVFTIMLLAAYSNHFYNGFHFDDSHTIVSNEAIKSLKNLPQFFTDATTFSSLPANRAYRPMVTTLNAVNIALGSGNLNPVIFHGQMFIWYILQLIFMFFLILNIFDLAHKHEWNPYFALFTTAYYGLHTCNAETINYLISISDSFSTLCIVAALWFYQMPKTRKYYLYFLPLSMAIYTKQTGAMFAPILFIYVLLFEEEFSFKQIFASGSMGKLGAALKKTLPTIVFCAAIFLFNQLVLTPSSTVSEDTGTSRIDYFMTQFYIITYYLGNFILPVNLSGDPDFAIIPSYTDNRILWGIFVVISMLTAAFFASVTKATRPITFGILFFFLALLPTSGFVPLFQIANDHRTFFPFVGLVIAVSSAVIQVVIVNTNRLKTNKNALVAISLYFISIIGAYGFGVYQRNKVWKDEETLWKDVAQKSPLNGRGLMNYGTCLMEKGEYQGAQTYFMQALQLNPYYSYLHINMGILKNAMGFANEAEAYFKNGLSYDRNNPSCYYYYGDWLLRQGRKDEAIAMFEDGLKVSPTYTGLIQRLEYAKSYNDPASSNSQTATVDTYINQSLVFYRQKDFNKCIEVCLKAIALDPKSAIAYNNLGAAYNQLQMWQKGADACKKALELEYSDLAKNNLQWAEDNLKLQQ